MRRLITILFGLISLCAGTVHGADITVVSDPFTVTVQREPINTVDPIFRAFLNVGENKFTFVIPSKFGPSGDTAHGRLILKTVVSGNCITLDFLEASANQGLSPESYKELLAERYPGGKIGRPYSHPVAGRVGTAFDVTWKSETGIEQITQAIYFPTVAGNMELTITSGAKKFKEAQNDFDQVLTTFTASVDGKLVVHHLSNIN